MYSFNALISVPWDHINNLVSLGTQLYVVCICEPSEKNLGPNICKPLTILITKNSWHSSSSGKDHTIKSKVTLLMAWYAFSCSLLIMSSTLKCHLKGVGILSSFCSLSYLIFSMWNIALQLSSLFIECSNILQIECTMKIGGQIYPSHLGNITLSINWQIIFASLQIIYCTMMLVGEPEK